MTASDAASISPNPDTSQPIRLQVPGFLAEFERRLVQAERSEEPSTATPATPAEG